VSLFDSTECVFPVPMLDGRRAVISDGFHAKGDARYRNGAGHRGIDIMYRRRFPALTQAAMGHPWGSRWHFMLPGIPALAMLPGKVYRAGKLSTGYHVIIDHGQEHGTGYHHLLHLLPEIERGEMVRAGQPLGIIGGSPVGYGLAHLHLDTAIKGRWQDPARWVRKWRHLTLEEAWAGRGRLSMDETAPGWI
jgi:murein DD-endopeptidase MepM/ murein hydrolase activator NlpD